MYKYSMSKFKNIYNCRVRHEVILKKKWHTNQRKQFFKLKYIGKIQKKSKTANYTKTQEGHKAPYAGFKSEDWKDMEKTK